MVCICFLHEAAVFEEFPHCGKPGAFHKTDRTSVLFWFLFISLVLGVFLAVVRPIKLAYVKHSLKIFNVFHLICHIFNASICK